MSRITVAILFAASVLSIQGCAHRTASPVGVYSEGPIPDDELRVIEVKPVGQAKYWWNVEVRFSAPMVPFEEARGRTTQPVLRIDPPIGGAHGWRSVDRLRCEGDGS